MIIEDVLFFQNESHKHLEENGSLLRDGTPSLAFSGIDDFKDPIQQKVIRTLEDGPTSRQKALVVSIWILSALFGASTCFPDKGFNALFCKVNLDQDYSLD